jgi:hypothetical protein
MAVRRSIVQFEKWLDGEIKQVEGELAQGLVEAEELGRKQAGQQIRLETLRAVKIKIAPVEDDQDGFTTIPQANGDEPEPELSLAFDADAEVTQ